MRHPLRRIESHARHVQRAGREVGLSPSPLKDHGLDSGISPVNLAISRYATQLSQYDDIIARGDLLALTLEQLTGDPGPNQKALLEFLGNALKK